MIEAFFSIMTNQYWFFSSYFAMYLVSPMLNWFVYKADLKMLYITSIVILIFAIPSLFFIDPFKLMNGYSFAWFVLLYVVGAIIKKVNFVNRISYKKGVLFVTSGFLLTWMVKVVLHFAELDILGLPISKFENILISYCSPVTLVVAVGLLCIFAKIKIGENLNKVVSFFAPTAFSVYLIHDNIYFRQFVIQENFTFINNYNPLLMGLLIPGCALIVFIICSFADRIRMALFKLLHIKTLSEKMEMLIRTAIIKLFIKLQPNK